MTQDSNKRQIPLLSKEPKKLKSEFESQLEFDQKHSTVWSRPAPCPQSLLIFQQIEVDDSVGSSNLSFKSTEEQSLIRLFGVSKEGNSILCHVHGFYPYFYVPAPVGFTSSSIQPYLHTLDVLYK